MIFILGLIIGSFLNCLIWRLNDPKAPKFWQGRSICPKCKHQLGWLDNIPLLSFILLRGKCRFCKNKISWQYPVVETLTAVTFVLLGQLGKLDLFTTILSCVFIVIFFSDLKYGFIPDEMILAGSFTALIYNLKFTIYNEISNFKFQISNLGTNFIIGFLTALPFYLLAKYGKMGYGDVKLAFLMGLLLGWPNILVALWFAFVLGGLTAGILLVLKKTKLSATIPLGPFLVLGVVLTALCEKVSLLSKLWWF